MSKLIRRIPTPDDDVDPEDIDYNSYRAERERLADNPLVRAFSTPETPQPPVRPLKKGMPLLFAWQRALCDVVDKSRETGLPAMTRLVMWTVSKHMNPDGSGAHPGQERL